MIPYEKKEHYTIDDLAEIVTLLRSKDGCPWDKVQTHESIRPDLIEETYEVIEAIDQNDPEMLREELGDLLLQVVFHSRIETEQGHFTLDDVCTDICNKLIIRHPHVFSTVQADTTEEVLKNWDTIKEETKHQTTRTQTLEAVAKTLPALMRAQKVCKRALKGNNRFLCNESVLASVTECKHTLEEAMHMEDAEQITRAMGELLFCCAGMAQTLGLSAEQVLTDTTNQFIDCFRAMEETCTAEKREMETLSHGEWNATPLLFGRAGGASGDGRFYVRRLYPSDVDTDGKHPSCTQGCARLCPADMARLAGNGDRRHHHDAQPCCVLHRRLWLACCYPAGTLSAGNRRLSAAFSGKTAGHLERHDARGVPEPVGGAVSVFAGYCGRRVLV